jgi:hypothetical protein
VRRTADRTTAHAHAVSPRVSLASATAEAQVRAFDEVRSRFQILQIKNNFALCDQDELDACGGMMHILINVRFGPCIEVGSGSQTQGLNHIFASAGGAREQLEARPLTFGDMVRDTQGFQAAVDSAIAANNPNHAAFFAGVAGLFKSLPGLAAQRVVIVAEIQLHLDFYVRARKQTHLWFKILRAETLKHLRDDCAAYRHC